MIKRKNFISKFTYNILDNIPSWMKLRQEESNGFPLINMFGQELERTFDQFVENFNDLFIKTLNRNQLDNIYFTDKRDLIDINTITASGSAIKVYNVNNEYDFFNGRPTRVQEEDTIILSGIASGIVSGLYNINYLYNYISGYYYIITTLDAINPSSIIVYNDNFNKIDNHTYASGRMDYDSAGFYEIIEPDTSGKLISNYPLYRMISSGSPEGIITEYRFEDHYTPQSSSGWADCWYYDEDGNIKYYFTRLNNPFGSGVYGLSSGWLKHAPVDGTMKVYDILNLNPSGEATEIPATGYSLYKYTSASGEFSYLGYNPIVPQIYHGYAGNTGTLFTTTNWFVGKVSGYLDTDVPPHSGTFQYIQGTGDSINILWFNNPISKYMIKYDYAKFRYLNDITTDNRYNHNIDMLSINPFVLNEEIDYDGHEIPWEFSKTSSSGLSIDPDYIRPGREADITVTVVDQHKKIWLNPSGSAFNLQLHRYNLGCFQNIEDRSYVKQGLL